MTRVVTLTILLAGILVISSSSPAWAAQMSAQINPNSDESFFKVNYQKTVFIEYPNGGTLFDELHTKEWTVSGVADESDTGVQDLIDKLNQKLQSDGSASSISALTVTYDFHLKGRNLNTSVDYKVILEG
ncbi:MAG: hypothetical protein ACO3K2_08115, partial [Nitrosopumilaceae archaeon]